ncbi:MAG TPA: RodZ domain-containing protein [Nitrospiria bacterium]
MESLGKYLQRVRKEKGISLEHIASRTKINPIYLKALEEDDLAKAPNQVFARGFIRSYLRTLSLDEKDVLIRYESFISEFFLSSKEKEQRSISSSPEAFTTIKGNRVGLLGFAGGLVALVLLIFLLVSQKPGDSLESQAIPQEVRVPHPLPVSQDYQPIISLIEPGPSETKTKPELRNSMTPLVVEKKESKPLNPPLNQTLTQLPQTPIASPIEKPLSLLIEALEQSWVLVYLDGTVEKEMTLQPGERYTLRAEHQFLVTLGNAGGIRMELNGKPLAPYGESGQVVRDILIKKGDGDVISFFERKGTSFTRFHIKVPA